MSEVTEVLTPKGKIQASEIFPLNRETEEISLEELPKAIKYYYEKPIADKDYRLNSFLSELVGWARSGGEIKHLSDEFKAFLDYIQTLNSEKKLNLEKLRQEVESYFDTIDGLCYLLDSLTEVTEGKRSESFRMAGARINQETALRLFLANRFEKGSPIRTATEVFKNWLFDTGVYVSSETIEQKMGSELKNLVLQAEAQATIMTILFNKGFQMFGPNPRDEEDLENMDLKGVDLVAYNNDLIILVDSKARLTDKGYGTERENLEIEQKDLPKDCLDYLKKVLDYPREGLSKEEKKKLEYLKKLLEKKEKILYLTITVPSSRGIQRNDLGIPEGGALKRFSQSFDKFLENIINQSSLRNR